MLKLITQLQKSRDFWFLFIGSIVFFLLRLPSFFEPYWYGDEGIYEVLGFGMRHGRLLYRDIWDNKPPLLYLIYALFNGDQAPVRIFSFVVGLIAVILFFFLTKKLFSKTSSQYTATILFGLLLGLPFLEGNIANAENFMILPSVGAALITFYLSEDKHLKIKHYLLLAISGLLLGISFLTKVVAVFDVAAFWFFLFVIGFQTEHFGKLVKQTFTYSVIFITTFLLPLLVTIIFFGLHGSLKTFFQSAFFSNVGYVNYGNQFIIPQGLLIAKLLLLGAIALFLLIKRTSFSKTQLFIYIWLSFSLFSALFSQRPYTHYLLVFIASFSLFIGLLIQEKKKVFNTVLLVLLIIFLAKNFWYYDKVLGYYLNFVQYVSGTKTTENYQAFFDKNAVRDYEIASYLKTVRKDNEPIFIWGNSAQIYKLAEALPPGRYTVAYHITTNRETLKETQSALIQEMPKYVIILQNTQDMPYQLKHYKMSISISNAIIYERTY